MILPLSTKQTIENTSLIVSKYSISSATINWMLHVITLIKDINAKLKKLVELDVQQSILRDTSIYQLNP